VLRIGPGRCTSDRILKSWDSTVPLSLFHVSDAECVDDIRTWFGTVGLKKKVRRAVKDLLAICRLVCTHDVEQACAARIEGQSGREKRRFGRENLRQFVISCRVFEVLLGLLHFVAVEIMQEEPLAGIFHCDSNRACDALCIVLRQGLVDSDRVAGRIRRD
jgi:hypothetical protein